MNEQLCAAKDLDFSPWTSWQVFAKALKAQFEPLSKEEHVREQTQKPTQMGNVHHCIYHCHDLQNDIPFMKLAEAYSLLMHGLNT